MVEVTQRSASLRLSPNWTPAFARAGCLVSSDLKAAAKLIASSLGSGIDRNRALLVCHHTSSSVTPAEAGAHRPVHPPYPPKDREDAERWMPERARHDGAGVALFGIQPACSAGARWGATHTKAVPPRTRGPAEYRSALVPWTPAFAGEQFGQALSASMTDVLRFDKEQATHRRFQSPSQAQTCE